MKYFNNIKTAEEAKQVFKKLAFDLHPDNNKDKDTTKDFQEMQQEFNTIWQKVKNIHVNSEGKTYEKETTETANEFIDIIEKLIHCPGLMIELCGAWLWITGNTKEHKDVLRQLGFKWSQNKAAWYYHREPFIKRSKKSVSLDEIRTMYGSQSFDQEEQKKITA